MTTIRDVLADAERRIAPVSTSASLDGQLLLTEVLGCNRAHVIAYPEEVLTPEQVAWYETLVARRQRGEPVAYILGRKAFYDREFIVTPAVLIPRPETEHLLEQALAFVQEHPQAAVVDVGTGSGALAITLADHAPQSTVYATDISPDALTVAAENAERQRVAVTLLRGDLLLPLVERRIRVDLVMANLPYIPTDELRTLAVSQYEPYPALDGGADGLAAIRRLLGQVPEVLHPGGMVLLEIGANQGEAVSQLGHEMVNAVRAAVLPDYAGHDRVVRIVR